MYKFESISGHVKIVPEQYTSRTCPVCQTRRKVQNRVYKCKNCNFVYDRDGIGAINIFQQNVDTKYRLDLKSERSCGLAPPLGVKFKNGNFKMLRIEVRNL